MAFRAATALAGLTTLISTLLVGPVAALPLSSNSNQQRLAKSETVESNVVESRTVESRTIESRTIKFETTELQAVEGHSLLQRFSAPQVLPQLIEYRIKRDLAARLNISMAHLSVESATRTVWPDSCLGLGKPAERCAEGAVRGWQVIARSHRQRWTYRSDRAAQRLRLEPLTDASGYSSTEEFSVGLAQRLLEKVSADVREPARTLRIVQVMPTLWRNGCLDLAVPETLCPQAAVPGFRVIVANDRPEEIQLPSSSPNSSMPSRELLEREWVYHLSADGSQIIQNSAASGADAAIAVFLSDPKWAFIHASEFNGASVVAQMKAEDYVSGSESYYTLTADGKVTYTHHSLQEDPIYYAVNQISAEEVERFKALLTQHQIERFSHLSYVSMSPDTAIDGSAVFSAKGASIGLRYNNIEALPDGLQAVMEAWMKMVI